MKQPALIVHGGAGRIHDDLVGDYVRGCEAAVAAGWRVLDGGGSALDAVEAAVHVMEDDPVFDAGRGSHLNRAGTVEMDAIIMDGQVLNAGAVAGVTRVRHPVSLARAVMEDTTHGMLIGAGAEALAQPAGLEQRPPEWFVVPREHAAWEAGAPPYQAARGHGTVGCVARDAAGNLASATSTGGTANKLPGRVGDSPLIGSGAYADNRTAAVSATGWGESLMRVVMSKTVCDLVGAGLTAQDAADAALRILVDRVDGRGGVIVVDHEGRLGFAFNTKRMARAFRDADGKIHAGIEPESDTSRNGDSPW